MKLSRPGVTWAWILGPAESVGMGEDGFIACKRCILREGLCHQDKEFWEEIIRLSGIRDYRRKWIKPQAILQIKETKPATALKEMQEKM